MDAGTLRIILIVFGALLLGVLYLWERRRIESEAEPEEQAHERSFDAGRREPSFGAPFNDAADANRAEDASEAELDEQARRSAALDVEPNARDASAGDDELDSDESDLERPGVRSGSSDREVSERGEAGASSVQPQRQASTSPVNQGSLLVQLFVVAQGEHFDGSDVQAVAERQHLIPGEMDIYHRRNLDSSSQYPLFSMANLVNPGTFPFDAMDSFTTPGVALFTQLEGLPSDLMVYDELVQTARSMADTLGGELLLPDRQPFDVEAWEGLRLELLSLINERAETV